MSTANGTPCEFYPGDYQLPDAIHKSYIMSAVVNGLLSVTATLGNMLVLSALWHCTSLHAPSKALLCNLAAADFLVGVLAEPLATVYYTVSVLGNRSLCHKVRSVWLPVGTLLSSVSLVVMVLITVDRLLAIHLRSRYREVVTLRRVVIVLIFAWTVGGPLLPLTGTLAGKAMYSYVAAIAIPLCIFVSSLCFYLIYKKLRQQTIKIHVFPRHGDEGTVTLQHSSGGQVNVSDYKRSVNTTMCLYVTMLVCYVPYFGAVAVLAVCGWNANVEAAMAVAETLIMFNSSLNPVLYCWRIKEVWQVVRALLNKICKGTSSTNSAC